MINIILEKPYKSSTVLAKELGVAASTIRSCRNRNGIFTKKKIPYISKEELLVKKEQLGSWTKVAQYFNASKTYILDIAKKYEIDTSKKPILTKEQEKYIVDNYYIMSASQLAKLFDVSDSKIAQIWSNNGKKGKQNRVYYLNNENYFEEINSQDKAYFLGFIASDGCIYMTKEDGKQNILRICISLQDEEILKKFKNVLQTNKPLLYYTKNTKKYVCLEISSNKIVKDLNDLGLYERKTYGNTIAKIDDKYMASFIRGYIDGDGSIRPKKDSDSDINIGIAGYKTNLEIINAFLMGRNIIASFVADNRKYTLNEYKDDFGSLTFTNRTAKYSLLKMIYCNCEEYYLERKHKEAMKFIDYVETSEQIRDKQIVLYYNYAVLPLC